MVLFDEDIESVSWSGVECVDSEYEGEQVHEIGHGFGLAHEGCDCLL